MQHLDVDGLKFSFPDDWSIGRYDDWRYYQNQFKRMWNGIKAVDLIAIDHQRHRTAWLIEVKDYRRNQRTKPSELPDEVAEKVFDTLAAMLPAKCWAQAAEQVLAKQVCGARRLCVVLHLEQPRKQSRLFPRAFDPANVKQKLRKLLKPVDPHPRVVNNANCDLGWQVS